MVHQGDCDCTHLLDGGLDLDRPEGVQPGLHQRLLRRHLSAQDARHRPIHLRRTGVIHPRV
eukprot:7979278-Pyramimonas_sp.AAC.1